MIPSFDWAGLWNWIAVNLGNLLTLAASFVAGMPTWVKVTIAGFFTVEVTRRAFKIARLLHHVREFERAEIERRLGVIEKPTWEREQKKTKEVRISGRIYHPIQSSPGGLWLQIASDKDDVQNKVSMATDIEKLIHHSVDAHSQEHRSEVVGKAAWGVVFIALFGYVIAFELFGLDVTNEQFIVPLRLLSWFYVGFLLCGLVVGIINPKMWFLAGLIAWVAVTIGTVMLNINLGEIAATPVKVILLLIALPLFCAFLGSYAGRLICIKLGRVLN
ncbi:hypothetical protein ACFLT0_01700 [Chloroflexota bacterium]